MSTRSTLSILFLTSGVFFFLLTALNHWELGSLNEDLSSLDETTSIPDTTIDLQHITARPLVTGSASDILRSDVVLIVFLTANYGCSGCPQHTTTYIEAFDTHATFEDLSTEAFIVVVEPDIRTATHFARIHQLASPAFQLAKVPTTHKVAENCFALLVDSKTGEAFFELQLDKAIITAESDAVFEAARDAYLQLTQE